MVPLLSYHCLDKGFVESPLAHAQVDTPSGKQEAYVTPQAIDQQTIAELVQQFADGARNAVAAGALGSANEGFA